MEELNVLKWKHDHDHDHDVTIIKRLLLCNETILSVFVQDESESKLLVE